MPVNPPYSVIDTIARLREQGGKAWGEAAQNVGTSIGTGLQKGMAGGAAMRANAGKADAAKYHDATLFADKNFDWQHSPAGMGGPGGAPGAGASGGSILQPANAAAAPGGQPPPAAPVKRPEGSVTMNDIYRAHGLPPVAGGDQIIGSPKAAAKAEAAVGLEQTKTAGRKEVEETKGKVTKDVKAGEAESKFDATHMEVDDKLGKLLGLPKGTYPTDFVKSKVGADQRKGTGETAAEAKVKVAEISAAARKAIAEISFRLKSPDHQIQLQAMKDRDAYIIKHPATSALFGTPADIGKTGKEKPAAEAAPAGGEDLDALMLKHGVR